MEQTRSNKIFVGIVIVLVLNQVLFRGLESITAADNIAPAIVLNVIRVIVYFGLGFYLASKGLTKKAVFLLVLAFSFLDHVALNGISFLFQLGSEETQGGEGLLMPIIGLLPSFLIVLSIALIVSLIGYRFGRSKTS